MALERSTQLCSRHGHPEFILTCAPEIAFDLPWLCGVLDSMVASGTVFSPGETFQLGWSTLMIRNAPGGMLSLWEPDLSGVPGQLDCSVSRSLLVLRRQKAVLESFGLSADRLDFPSMSQTAVQCTRFSEASRRMLSRIPRAHAEDSGWFFGCLEDDHDHQRAENLIGGSLYERACAIPIVLDFLAMPSGSIICMDRLGGLEKAFGPEEQELKVRDGSYLSLKPKVNPA